MTQVLNMLLVACALKATLALKISTHNQTQPAKLKAQVSSVQCYHADGFGPQYHCQMAAFAKARHDHQCFIAKPFTRYTSIRTMNVLDGNEFTGLKTEANCEHSGEGKQVCVTPTCAEGTKDGKEDIDSFYTKEVRNELRQMYWSHPKPEPDTSCEVAIHVRAGDVWDGKKIPVWVIADALSHQFDDMKVCVFTEGKVGDFQAFGKLKNVEFKLNNPVDETFHNLVAAPNLVLSKSSFSYSAGVISKWRVHYIQKFWHKMLPSWNQIPLGLLPSSGNSEGAFGKMFGRVQDSTVSEDAPADWGKSDFD